MTSHAAEARLKELTDEVARRTLDGTVTHEFMDRVEAESKRLNLQERNSKAALKHAGSASPEEFGRANVNPGDDGPGINWRGFGPNMQNRVNPVSMYEMSRKQIKALQHAALQRTSFKVEVGQKGIESGYYGGAIRDKSAVTESGLTPNLLPPIQQLGDRGFFGLPYELTRVSNFLVNIAFQSAGIAYFRHDSNGTEAGYTAEGTLKLISLP
jgi:hypothetical protein